MAALLRIRLIFVLGFSSFCIGDAAPQKNNVGMAGGVPVRIEDFPYQVSVRFKNYYICGGSIIHKRFILTAAHCLNNRPFLYSVYKVLVGTANFTNGGTIYEVETIVKHPRSSNGQHDLSLVKLKRSLVLSEKVAIAKLPTMDKNFKEGTVFNVTGWGLVETEGSASRILLRSEVPFVDLETCIIRYRGVLNDLNDPILCAGTDGQDVCKGDSGGPLTWNGTVIGIMSLGWDCAHKGYPTVYTKISKYRKWIRKTIRSK